MTEKITPKNINYWNIVRCTHTEIVQSNKIKFRGQSDIDLLCNMQDKNEWVTLVYQTLAGEYDRK